MLSNLKKINNEFDKKLELLSFRNLKNLFKKRRSKVKIDEESNNENKKYIDFQIKVSSEVIELRKMLEESINTSSNNSKVIEPEESKHLELLKFLQDNVCEDRKLPKESEILEAINISEWELRVLKTDLVKEGHLEQPNKRTFLLKTLKNTKLSK